MAHHAVLARISRGSMPGRANSRASLRPWQLRTPLCLMFWTNIKCLWADITGLKPLLAFHFGRNLNSQKAEWRKFTFPTRVWLLSLHFSRLRLESDFPIIVDPFTSPLMSFKSLLLCADLMACKSFFRLNLQPLAWIQHWQLRTPLCLMFWTNIICLWVDIIVLKPLLAFHFGRNIKSQKAECRKFTSLLSVGNLYPYRTFFLRVGNLYPCWCWVNLHPAWVRTHWFLFQCE